MSSTRLLDNALFRDQQVIKTSFSVSLNTELTSEYNSHNSIRREYIIFLDQQRVDAENAEESEEGGERKEGKEEEGQVMGERKMKVNGLVYSPCTEEFVSMMERDAKVEKEAIVKGSRTFWRCISNISGCVQYAKIIVFKDLSENKILHDVYMNVTIGNKYSPEAREEYVGNYPNQKLVKIPGFQKKSDYLHAVRYLLDCIWLEVTSEMQDHNLTMFFYPRARSNNLDIEDFEECLKFAVHYGKDVKYFEKVAKSETQLTELTRSRKWVKWTYNSNYDAYEISRTKAYTQPKMDKAINPFIITDRDYEAWWLSGRNMDLNTFQNTFDLRLMRAYNRGGLDAAGEYLYDFYPHASEKEKTRVKLDVRDAVDVFKQDGPLLWAGRKSILYQQMVENLMKYHTSRMLTDVLLKNIRSPKDGVFKQDFLEYDLINDGNSIILDIKKFRHNTIKPNRRSDVKPHPIRKYWDLFYNVNSIYAFDQFYVVFTDPDFNEYVAPATLISFYSKYADTLRDIPAEDALPTAPVRNAFPTVRLQLDPESFRNKKMIVNFKGSEPSEPDIGSEKLETCEFSNSLDEKMFNTSYAKFGFQYTSPTTESNKYVAPDKRSPYVSAVKMAHIGNRVIKKNYQYVMLTKNGVNLAAIEYERTPSITKNSFDIPSGSSYASNVVQDIARREYDKRLFSEDFAEDIRVSRVSAINTFYLATLVRAWSTDLIKKNKEVLRTEVGKMCARIVFQAYTKNMFELYSQFGLERDSLLYLLDHYFSCFQVNIFYIGKEEIEKMKEGDIGTMAKKQ